MKNKKKLKGFTLIELVIVMAIFGVLMVSVMSIITPLNRIAKKASIQEANTAAVDNVKLFLEGSIRYSDCLEVFNGDLVDRSGNILLKPDNSPDQETAVKNFIINHYNNRTDPGTDKPLTGKVRILKIDNDPTKSDGRGHIYETEYDFTAGYTYYKVDDNATEKDALNRVYKTGTTDYDLGTVDPVIKAVTTDKHAVNDAYYENYSFYFVPGYNNTNTVGDKSVIQSASFDTSNDESDIFYSEIIPQVSQSGATYPAFSKDFFSLSVITYRNQGSIGYVPDDPTTPVNEAKTLFRSPSALSNITMSLVNMNSAFSTNNISGKYGRVRYDGSIGGTTYQHDSTVIDLDNDSNCDYEDITDQQAPFINETFHLYPTPAASTAETIYFIYTLPNLR